MDRVCQFRHGQLEPGRSEVVGAVEADERVEVDDAAQWGLGDLDEGQPGHSSPTVTKLADQA